MKKVIVCAMLAVFAFSFVGTVLVNKVEAKPVFCPKDPPCAVQVFPDGSKYICCFTYVKIKKECVLTELPCYWEYPSI